MKKSLFLFFVFLISSGFNLSAEETRMYRLYLKDKGDSPFRLENPEEFLSEKSIQRREKQGYSINESDLPYDPSYFECIRQTGATIQTYSKWVNTIVVHVPDMNIVSELENLFFVDSLHCVWRGTLPSLREGKTEEVTRKKYDDINNYGAAYTQISVNKGHLLHKLGFYGSGLSIAVMDGGFGNVDKISFFDQSKIKEVKSFNHETTNPLGTSSDHGTNVLSCLLANKPGEFVGTAPQADYYLFRTEVMIGEYPVEEDYWIAALEYADSIGVDIVTTSLGYSTFDDPTMNHTHSQLDGKTIPASRAASMAASKGLLVFNSAGNEGSKTWRKILVPADADSILTVGSVTGNSALSSFSSRGNTFDGRIKPDIMAMGSDVRAIGSSGSIIASNGTSFSTPIMAGLSACLWEAFPQLTNMQIIQLIRKTASHWDNPDSSMGYGIADVFKAYEEEKGKTNLLSIANADYIRYDQERKTIYINFDVDCGHSDYSLTIYSSIGRQILNIRNSSNSIDLGTLPDGVYITLLQIGKERFVKKIVKL